ncbi:hypothetical protein V495_04670 [Pseudogymnoascus sp. VKM F-4514 (FW-929)]|nr:hypothetical protein V495_04670 [Pseudogymnoascus sp. VKM F-4514 (FW-929)]KFY64936.1 hypothetical protein V497_01547 [Pseudogymnoascus sp. VKM F-4516 (FW-969)]
MSYLCSRRIQQTTMSRHVRLFAIPRSVGLQRRLLAPSLTIRQFASPSRNGSGSESPYTDEEYTAAREWASTFKPGSLPRNLAQTRFDRSSGKGGQHVNKTNSKATSAWPVNSIAPFVPDMVTKELRASRYYSKNSDCLTIASQEGRVQRDNEDNCHEKLYKHIADIAMRIIPGEASEAAKAKAAKQKKIGNSIRLQAKKDHSAKKQSRSSKGGDY